MRVVEYVFITLTNYRAIKLFYTLLILSVRTSYKCSHCNCTFYIYREYREYREYSRDIYATKQL